MIRPKKQLNRPYGQQRSAKLIAAVVVLAVALALIAIGVFGGAGEALWQRASLICYECIGIG